MTMLIIETFLLMLLAGILGVGVGSLIACRSCCGAQWSNDRPWLRDGRAAPPPPALPTAPELLSDAERRRLAAALAESETAAARSAAASSAVASSAVAASTAPAAVAVVPRAPAETAPPSEPSPVAAVDETQLAPAPTPEPAPAPEPEPAAPAASEPASPPAEEPAPAVAYELPAAFAAAAVAPTVAAEDADRAAAADAVGTRPLALAAPLGGKADDLKRVRGIGPQNERKLHGLGVYHFSQIAAWTAENAKWAGSFMAFPGRIEREGWIAQATILATGADTEFSKRVDAGEVPTSQSDGKKG